MVMKSYRICVRERRISVILGSKGLSESSPMMWILISLLGKLTSQHVPVILLTKDQHCHGIFSLTRKFTACVFTTLKYFACSRPFETMTHSFSLFFYAIDLRAHERKGASGLGPVNASLCKLSSVLVPCNEGRLHSRAGTHHEQDSLVLPRSKKGNSWKLLMGSQREDQISKSAR